MTNGTVDTNSVNSALTRALARKAARAAATNVAASATVPTNTADITASATPATATPALPAFPVPPPAVTASAATTPAGTATPDAGATNATLPARRFMRNPLNPGGTNQLPPAIPVLPAGQTAAAPAAPGGITATPGAAPAPTLPTLAQPAPFAAAPTAIPAPAKPEEPVIPAGQINFPAMDINQVLDFYAILVGRTVLRPSALPAGVITLKTQTALTKTEAIQALDSVLALNGITMIPVGEKFVKALPEGQVMSAATKWTEGSKDDLPEAGEFVTRIVSVKNAKPSEVQPVLQGFAKIPNSIMAVDASGILIIRDYAENVKRMLELIDKIDVTVPMDYISQVIPIKYALASDIASALGSLGGGTGTSIGHSAASAGGAAGGSRLSSPGGFGGPGSSPFGQPGQLGQPGYNQPGGIGSPGAVNPGGARATSFQDRLNSIVRKASQTGEFQVLGQTKIIADERTNSLLVFASQQDMDMITNIIGKLDVVLAQVLIEAIIMEVTLSDDQSLGVSYLQNNASQIGNYFTGKGALKNGSFLSPNNFGSLATNAAGALPSGFSYLANFGGDFTATITALAEDHKVNVLSRPRIQTSHAVPASLQIGDTVPYVTGTYFNGVNGTPNSQYQQTFVGINLQVTPLINPDGLVVMDITQDIQQLGTPTVIDGNPVPTTTKRTAQAKVSVKDRDTIMLGGFISTTKTKDKSGIPILKDIPGLGYLFRSTSDSNKRVELIVLIRPTVLPNPGDAALVAMQERNRMPGVRQAQAENDADEAKRIKEGDRQQAKRDAEAAKHPSSN
jgi:general secretion pathway protein D